MAISNFTDLFYESQYSGNVVGVDEAGRGPWAGPVVAGAVNLNASDGSYFEIQGINDSKKLSAKKRKIIFQQIIENCDFGIGIVDVDIIDDINILQATKLAMQQAVSSLKIAPDMVLVDGNQCPEFQCQAQAIVKGDSKSLSIAAASIIAKVTRDNIMQELHLEFPGFGWDRNAGYGTKLHQEGLSLCGVTKHHRKSYAPIKKLLAG